MIMSGSLAEWSVEDLLHLVRITQKTTSIRLVGDSHSGVVHLSRGAIVAVEVEPSTGDAGDDFSRAVDGIRALTSQTEGTFEFRPAQRADDADGFEVEHILAAVQKDLRREQRLAGLGVGEGQPLALSGQPAGPVTFQIQAWQLLAPLVPVFSLGELERRFGRGRAVATVLMLDALGILERPEDTSSTDSFRPLPDEQAQEDPTPGDSTPEDPTRDEPVSEEPTPEGPPAGDQVSEQPVSGDAVPEDQAVEGTDDDRSPVGHRPEERDAAAAFEDHAEPAASTEQDEPVASRDETDHAEAGERPAIRPQEGPMAALIPIIDPADSLGAHYVEIFDHQATTAQAAPVAAHGGRSDMTLVSGVLTDIRSRFRSGPSHLEGADEADE